MTTRAQFISLVEAKVQDLEPGVKVYDTSRGLSSANLLASILDNSIAELSDYAKRVVIEDFTGTGSRYYSLVDTLSGWLAADDDNAEVNRVWLDWPTSSEESTDRDYDELPIKYWTVDYWLIATVQKKALIFRGASYPTSSSVVRVEYSINHTFPAAGDISLEDKHADAFSNLVAGRYLLEGFASKMLQFVSKTPTADIVAPLNPVRTAQSAAQILIDKFYEHFGDDPRAPGKMKLRQWTRNSNKTRRHWLCARK